MTAVVIVITPVGNTAASSTTAFYADDGRALLSLPIVDAPTFEIYDRLFDVDVGQALPRLEQLQRDKPADRTRKSIADPGRRAYHLRL